MSGAPFLLAFLLTCCVLVHSASPVSLSVVVNQQTGGYVLSVNGQQWLTSGITGFHAGNVWYTTGSTTNPLKLISSSTYKGSDALGPFDAVELKWQGGNLSFITTVQSYSNLPAVVFVQSFPDGAIGTASGTNEDVITAFPSFQLPAKVDLNYLTFSGSFAPPAVGKFSQNSYQGNVQGGIPLVLYDQTTLSLTISPFNNFMVGIQTLSGALGNQLAFGLNGKIQQIPKGFSHSTIFFAGPNVHSGMYNWGSALLTRYQKARATANSDPIISGLGYWTDNGAYYYYTTEPNKNYEDTMIDVAAYLKQIRLPITNVQFDSWWYFKGVADGVTLWEPTSQIFPHGMAYLNKMMGNYSLTLHNRYFASNNEYLSRFRFITEGTMSLPLDQNLFDYIMRRAIPWGLKVYEQDWLITTYNHMESAQNNVSNARDWLIYMNNAAQKLGLTIQYCMPLPNHLLQSVECPAVTQARASDDYQPGNSQWKIGYTSLLYWSIGLVPFKDDFWTTNQTQAGCRYHKCQEPNPELETLVATLSSGPVGPSDMIGKLNRTRVMQTCREDGVLLKADKPATPVESVFTTSFSSPQIYQVVTSHTRLGAYAWRFVLGADLDSPFTVLYTDLGFGDTDEALVYNYFTFLQGPSAAQLSKFDKNNPLKIPANQHSTADAVGYSYYVVSPVLSNGWVFLGEFAKFIAVSSQRVSQVRVDSTSVTINFKGAIGEKVNFYFLTPKTSLVLVSCIVSSNEQGSVICQGSSSCSCNDNLHLASNVFNIAT